MRRAALASFILLVVSACGPTPRDPNIIVVAMANSPTNFDPAVGLDEASQKIHQLLFSSLVRIDASLRVVPDLAVRFDWPDPLTYVAELPTGVRFHDGTELTAADVAYTFRRFLDPAFVSGRKGAYRALKSIDVIVTTAAVPGRPAPAGASGPGRPVPVPPPAAWPAHRLL